MSSIFSHGTIIRTRIVFKKIALQKSIEFDMVSRARLAINKKQKYFQTNNLLKTRFLFLVCKKWKQEDKSKHVTKYVGIIVMIIFL